MAGATYDQIATAVGYRNKGSAHEAVRRALAVDTAKLVEQRDEYRNLLLARCERLVRSLWQPALDRETPVYERVNLIREIRALLEREAKLLGTDAPAQVVVTEVTTSALLDLLDDMQRIDEARPIEARVIELDEHGMIPEGNGDDPH